MSFQPIRPPLKGQAQTSTEKQPVRATSIMPVKKRIVHKTAQDKVGFVAPLSLEEGKSRYASLLADLELIKGDLQTRTDQDFDEPAAFFVWRSKAKRALGYKKAHIQLLEGWFSWQKIARPKDMDGVGSSAPPELEAMPQAAKLPFKPPAHLEDGQLWLTELNTEILALQAELSRISGGGLGAKEWKRQKALALARLQPKQALRSKLGDWLKRERRKINERIEERVSGLSQRVDPNDPVNLVFHSYRIVKLILKETGFVLSGENQIIIEVLWKYLNDRNCAF